MVYRYGMGDSGLLGNFDALASSSGYSSQAPNLSEELKSKIDADVQTILHRCQKEVEEIIYQEKEVVEYFAQELLKKEELEYDEIVEIFKKHGKERSQDSTS